jgi:acyl carrier protein
MPVILSARGVIFAFVYINGGFMDRKSIYEELKLILCECLKGRTKGHILTDTTDIITELKIDSIEALEILLRTEEKFGISIDDEDLNKELFRTLGKLTDYLQQRLL